MTGGDLRDAKVKLTQKKRKELVSYGSSWCKIERKSLKLLHQTHEIHSLKMNKRLCLEEKGSFGFEILRDKKTRLKIIIRLDE